MKQVTIQKTLPRLPIEVTQARVVQSWGRPTEPLHSDTGQNPAERYGGTGVCVKNAHLENSANSLPPRPPVVQC